MKKIIHRGRAIVLLGTLLACNEPVTDPLGDFHSDPAPVLGVWRTVDAGALRPSFHDARILRGAGVLLGTFEYPLHGRRHVVQFTDAIWNGSSLVFTSQTSFGFILADSTVTWSAQLIRDVPPRLVLTASTVEGPAFSWTYRRPGEL